MTETHFSLPRVLVNQLLHAAQSHPNQNHWGIITSRNGDPEFRHQLDDGPQFSTQTMNSVRALLTKNREKIWGIYCSCPGEISTPVAAEVLASFGTPRFLGISLGTKGVLQLRGWHLDAQRVAELTVMVRED